MQTQDIIALILVYLIIVAALGLSMFVQKKGINWDNRKIVHIGVGFFIYIWWAFTANWIMLLFFAVPFEIVLIITAIPGNALSNSKLGELSNDMGHRFGLVFYVLTIIIMVVFFNDGTFLGESHWLAATIGIVAMTRGDGFGSIVGKKYGKHKFVHGKSLEGSVAVFLATFIVSLIVIGVYGFFLANPPFGWFVNAQFVDLIPAIGYALVAGILASVIEAVAPGDYDNLAMPIIITVVLVLLGL